MPLGRLRTYIERVLQCCFKHGGGSGDYDRDKNQEETYGNPTRNVILTTHNDKEIGFCRQKKGDKGYRAVFYGP